MDCNGSISCLTPSQTYHADGDGEHDVDGVGHPRPVDVERVPADLPRVQVHGDQECVEEAGQVGLKSHILGVYT